MDYNADVELDARYSGDARADGDLADLLMDDLADYHVSVGRTPHGRISLILTVPGHSIRQATSTVLAVVAAAGHPEPYAVAVLPTDEFHRRIDEETVPPLLSVTGAAEVLGVSRGRVQQLIDAGQVAAVKIGAVWAVLRTSAEKRAIAMAAASDRPEVLSYGVDD